MTIATHTSEYCSSNGLSCGPALQITSDTVQPSPRASTRLAGCPLAWPSAHLGIGSNSTAIFAKNISSHNDTTLRETPERDLDSASVRCFNAGLRLSNSLRGMEVWQRKPALK